MKARLSILGLALLLALTACNRPIETRHDAAPPPEASPELAAIDSLMWQRPDSAMAVLMDYFACRDVARNVSENSGDSTADVARHVSTTCDRHYAHLLLAELLYKNDHGQNNRDDLLKAVAYFDSLTIATDTRGADTRGVSLRRADRRDASHAFATDAQTIAFLTARAHYINGVGQYERDSVVEACKEYLKALEVMERCFEEKELVGKKAKFLALAYTHLTNLFSDLYLHEQALYFGKHALMYYQRHDATPWHIAWVLNELGSHYDMMENYDSASIYYRKSLTVLPDTNNLTYRDIATHLAYLSYNKEETPRPSLDQLNILLSQAENEKEYLSRCLTIGTIYYRERQLDSAEYYMGMVFHGTNSHDSKVFTAQKLQEISLIKGDTATANEYAIFLSQFAIPRDRYGKQDSELAEQYHAYIQQRQEMAHQERTRRLMKWSLGIALFLTFVGIVFMVFNLMNRKRQRHLIRQNEGTEEIMKKREIQYSAALGKAKKTIERLQRENKTLKEHKKLESDEKEWLKVPIEEYDALMREALCIDIRRRLKKSNTFSSFDVSDYSDMALSAKETAELIQMVDKHCPNFSNRLITQYPKLNNNDIQLCRLYLFDLKILQAAILLGTDYSSVRKRTKRLKGKIGSDELHLQLKSTLFGTN